MGDTRLTAAFEGEELVIRIGVVRLAHSAEQCQALHKRPGEFGPPYCRVVDEVGLARDVICELQGEEEDGTTPLDLLFDQCIVAAMENGSTAFDETFKAKRV